jgi:hypothetical protein
VHAKKPAFAAVATLAALLLAACADYGPFVHGGKSQIAGHWRIAQ